MSHENSMLSQKLTFTGKIVKLGKQKCCQECSVSILINQCSLFNRILVSVRLKPESIRFSNKSSPQDNHVSFKIILFHTKLQWNQLSPTQNKEMKGQASTCFPLSLVMMFYYIPTPFSLLFLKRRGSFMLWSVQEQVEEGLEGQPVSSKRGNSLLSHLIPASSEQQHNNLLNLFDMAHMLEATWTLLA